MKFLALFFFICAANAATYNRRYGLRPWEVNRGFARASAEVSAPVITTVAEEQKAVEVPVVEVAKTAVEPVAKPVAEPVVKTVVQPAVETVVPIVPEVTKVVVPVVPKFVPAVAQPVQNVQYNKVSAVPTLRTAQYVDKESNAAILRSDSDVHPEGFDFAYETANGIAASSTGVLKNDGKTAALKVQGQYQYTSPEGIPIQLSYVADEFGYQPRGDILPVAPPVPVAITRALQYIAAHPPKEESRRY